MKRTLVRLIIAAGLAAFISGCASGPIPLPDTVAIVEIQPKDIPESEFTSFNVRVAYALRSTDHAVVMLGFDLEEPGRFILLGEQTVAGGVGEVDVEADVRLPKRDTVTLHVNLSEKDHPSEWTPLAEATRRLTIAELLRDDAKKAASKPGE
jgi:hypothetical protein